MKSFLRFVLFIVGWFAGYFIISQLFNFGINLLSNAINFESLIGLIIGLSIICSVMWFVLFFPTLLLAGATLDKSIYAMVSMIILIIYNAVAFFILVQVGIMGIIVWLCHAISTILPLWIVYQTLHKDETSAKIEAEKAYRDTLKSEIINEMRNSNN